MGGGEKLPGAVGVEDAQHDGLGVPQAADGADVILGGQLGDGVGGARIGADVFAQRLLAPIAIHRAGGGEDDAFDAHVAHRLHHRHRPAAVYRVVLPRVADRFRHRDAGRQVVEAIDVLPKGPEFRAIEDIASGEVNVGVEAGGGTGGGGGPA